MKIKFLLITIAVNAFIVKAQGQIEEIQFRYYQSTPDYVNRHLSDETISGKVKKISDDYIWLKLGLINTETSEKSKDAPKAWAIHYEGEDYFNMDYVTDFAAPNFYMKFDVTGHYSLIILDDEDFATLEKARQDSYYGGGLSGVLINDAVTWGGSWLNESGEKMKLIFVNLGHLSLKSKRGTNAPGFLLTKALLKDLIQQKDEKKVAEYKVEEIIEIIQAKNQAKQQ